MSFLAEPLILASGSGRENHVLGQVDPRRDETIDAGLEILRSKRGRDGMWKMVGGLNGKMHADLDRRGKPSPWITYRALLAFKRFGQLELPITA